MQFEPIPPMPFESIQQEFQEFLAEASTRIASHCSEYWDIAGTVYQAISKEISAHILADAIAKRSDLHWEDLSCIFRIVNDLAEAAEIWADIQKKLPTFRYIATQRDEDNRFSALLETASTRQYARVQALHQQTLVQFLRFADHYKIVFHIKHPLYAYSLEQKHTRE